MKFEIRTMKKRDCKKAIQFAIKGMHFNRLVTNEIALQLYGSYFRYDELLHATQMFAAYYGDTFAGVLLVNMKGEKKKYHSVFAKLFVRAMDFIQYTFYRNGADPYDNANREMLRRYTEEHPVDGEINFLAANPDLKVRGIGTLLLLEFEKHYPGKRIFLYTDDNCNWQFYDHRGFEQVGKRKIFLGVGHHGSTPMTCYLYSKVCGT